MGQRIDHLLHTLGDSGPATAAIHHEAYSGYCGATTCNPSDHFAVEVGFRVLLGEVSVDLARSEALCESGTGLYPFNTVPEAINAAKSNAVISIRASSLGDGFTINPVRGPVTITSVGGPSVLGKR